MANSTLKVISHRGFTKGPDPDVENHPWVIEQVSKKYDVEIDVWGSLDSPSLWLGHDYGQYGVNDAFFINLKDKLWCHAKNLLALERLIRMEMNCFYHTDDYMVVTTKGFIWTANSAYMSPNGVLVWPQANWKDIVSDNLFGVCTDYVE